MMASMLKVILVALALPVVGAIAFAAEDEGVRVRAEDPAAFSAQKERIEREIRGGKTYAEIGTEQLRDVRSRLDRMGELLAERGSVHELTEPEKIAFFNDQEAVNTILTQAAEDSRLVCRREHKVGSRMPVNECYTVAERRRAQIEASNQQADFIKRGEPRGTLGERGL